MSHVKTDKLSARTPSGTITLGESGETFALGSGATVDSGFTPDAISINASAPSDALSIDASGGVIFNENGVDADFRVESDANTHMLFVDAGNNRVGIGKSSPNQTLHVDGPINSEAFSTIVLTGGVASNLIATSNVLTSATLSNSIILITLSGSNGVDGGFNGYYLLNLNKNFSNYAVTVIVSGLPHNNSGYGFTFTLDANNLMINPNKTSNLNYNYIVIAGAKTN